MEQKDVIDFFEKQLSRVNYWLSFAEAKNAALVVFNAAILAALMRLLLGDKDFIKGNCFLMLVLTLTFIVTIASLGIALYSFRPSLESSSSKGSDEAPDFDMNTRNLLFYGTIAKLKNARNYHEYIYRKYNFGDKTKNELLVRDYSEEIYINSKIAAKKYENFQWALKLDVVVALCVLVMVLVIIFCK